MDLAPSNELVRFILTIILAALAAAYLALPFLSRHLHWDDAAASALGGLSSAAAFLAALDAAALLAAPPLS